MANMSLQTVERAFMVLELIAAKPMTQQQLEAATGLNRSTVRRLVYTLQEQKYIDKDPYSSNYTLGLKVVELSSMKLNQVELKTEAMPFLRELSSKLNQTCHMGILSDERVVYIEKLEPLQSIRMFSAIGKRVPVHSSSLGKVLLTSLDDDMILKLLNKRGLPRFTPKTITDPEQLLKEIHQAKINGYAVDNEENEENIWCIAVPVFDYRNEVIAAISTSGKHHDFIDNPNSQIITIMKQASYSISQRMGYKG